MKHLRKDWRKPNMAGSTEDVRGGREVHEALLARLAAAREKADVDA